MAWVMIPTEDYEHSVCSQGLGASMPGSGSGVKPFAIVKLNHTPLGSSLRIWFKVLWMLRLFGTTLKLSEKLKLSSLRRLNVFRGGSPARILVPLEKERASKKGRGLGSFMKSCVLFAWLSPKLSSWRTFIGCSQAEWASFSASFPSAGIMQSGQCYRPASSNSLIAGKGFGFLPTPVAGDLIGMWCSARLLARGKKHRPSGASIRINLSYLLAKWHLQNGGVKDSIVPDPCLYEAIMGYPPNWTSLD